MGTTEEQPAAAEGSGVLSAGAKGPSFAAKVPHAGVESFGILRIHRQHGAAGGRVGAFQNLVPSLSAVRRFVKTAVVAVAPQFSGSAGKHRVAIFRVNDDSDDALRILQTHVGPVLAAIGGFVNTIADGSAVARPRFAGAYPNSLGSGGINGDGADGLHRLFVENRIKGHAVITGLKQSAGRKSHEKDRGIARIDRDVRDASTHRGRPN